MLVQSLEDLRLGPIFEGQISLLTLTGIELQWKISWTV
jgi:hypothetical protein